jgi:hypothetical protein
VFERLRHLNQLLGGCLFWLDSYVVLRVESITLSLPL